MRNCGALNKASLRKGGCQPKADWRVVSSKLISMAAQQGGMAGPQYIIMNYEFLIMNYISISFGAHGHILYMAADLLFYIFNIFFRSPGQLFPGAYA